MSLQKRFKKPSTTITALTPFTGPRLLRIKPAAAYLSLGVGTLRKMVKDRTIPHVPEGNKFLIDRFDLDRWIEKAKVGVAA
jgi:excisionase family DNA binding protein